MNSIYDQDSENEISLCNDGIKYDDEWPIIGTHKIGF